MGIATKRWRNSWTSKSDQWYASVLISREGTGSQTLCWEWSIKSSILNLNEFILINNHLFLIN